MDLKLLQQEFRQELDELEQKGLRRSLEVVQNPQGAVVQINGKRFINFCSNNYLGLANHARIARQTTLAVRKWGSGSGASRLLSGNLAIHEQFEIAIAQYKQEEAALAFSSGYLANVGVITSLLNEKDLILVDRLNHASLIDAARLCGAKLWVYRHKDLAAVEKLLERGSKLFRRRLVVTDAYFSMDGDVAPLIGLYEACERHQALLMIDEAHSTGVFGSTGRGLTEQFGLQGKLAVVMGTMSKALGSVGGYVAGSATLREYLINRCRPFIFSTAPSPAATAAALAATQWIGQDLSAHKTLWQNIRMVRAALAELDYDTMDSEGPIVPILIGDTHRAIAFSQKLKAAGILAPVIRPPTVPKNTDRIRISITASHKKQHLSKLMEVLKRLRKRS